MLRGIRKQISLVDRSMLWLKELYIQLYYENGGCEPLASDALRVSLLETFNINELNLNVWSHFRSQQAFGGTDYSFLSTTTSTPDSVHSVKKDLAQQQGAQPQTQQSTPTTSMKKKRSVVNLFCYNNVSELLTQQQQQPSQSSNSQSMQSQTPQLTTQVQQQSITSSLCDTNSASAKRYSAFNNISFDTNLDFLSFVSLYRSFR